MKIIKGMKRALCLLLSMVMVLGYLPAGHAHAASNVDGGLEGQTADIFTALGFDTSVLPEGYDPETTDNPYGRTKVPGNQIFEMVLTGRRGRSRAGYDNNEVNVQDVTHTRLSGDTDLTWFTSMAGDFDGDGLEGELVYISPLYLYAGATSASLYMYVYDGKSDKTSEQKYIDSIAIPFCSKENISADPFVSDSIYDKYYLDYEIQNLLDVTAGDFDGDGYDEIAVYVPSGENMRVDIYKWMRDENSQPTDWMDLANWSVIWTHTISNKPGAVQNMISLLAMDVNRDGIDDLGLSWGYVDYNRYYKSGISFSEQKNVAETGGAMILWGDRNKMFQSSSPIDLMSSQLGEMTRISLTCGDLDLDGYDELVVTGQPTTDVFRNTTRSIIVYTYDGVGGLTALYNGNHKPLDGSQSYDDDGNPVWTSNNGFDGVYNSKPYMNTNAAVLRLEGYDYGFLYLDSCLYEYMEGSMTLKMALDDPSYDGSHTLDNLWLSSSAYFEYGATAADLNGDGYDQLYVSYYGYDSHMYARYDNGYHGQHHRGGFSGLQGGGDETLTNSTFGSSLNQEGQFYVGMPWEGEEGQDFSSPTNVCCYNLTAADVDMDTTIIEYTGNHWLSYSDPKILAVIAAAPYFEDVDVICNYDYAWQNTTSWSQTHGGGRGSTVQVDLEAGVYVSEASKFNELEIATMFTMEWADETSNITEYTLTFETSQDEDAVAFLSTPTEHYEYIIYTPDGKGGYNEEPDLISRPFQAVYQVLNLDYYESIRKDFVTDAQGNSIELPQIAGTVLTSTPGDPASYPSSTNGYDVINEWDKNPAAVSFGNGAITQEITFTKENCVSYNFGAAFDFQAGFGYKGISVEVLGGATVSLNPSGGFMNYDISGTTITGTVTNMPLEFQDYGYYYDWKLFSYHAQVGDASIPVVSYVVDNVSEPPKLPDDFQQDVERTTSDKNVLTWSYDQEYSKFILYKYYDFPVGGGLEILAEYEAGEAPYVLKYDEEGNPYKEFYFEDVNLAPYSEHQYAIQVERLSKVPPLSAPSGLVTARTKAAEGNPVLTIVESDGKNDGKAMVYPDKNSYLIAQVTGPDGEIGSSYYSTIQYQWQKKNDQGKWEDQINETNQTLTIDSAGSDTAGEYRCLVNVITNTDNTAISAYTDSVELVYSKRTSIMETAYAREVKGGIEFYAKVVNAHTDSGTVPTGTVVFNMNHVQSGAYYQIIGQLDTTGTMKQVVATALPAGTYNVQVTYSGDVNFKVCSSECVFLAQVDKGYTIDAPESVTYGEGASILFNEVTTVNGFSVKETVQAGFAEVATGEEIILDNMTLTLPGYHSYPYLREGMFIEKYQSYALRSDIPDGEGGYYDAVFTSYVHGFFVRTDQNEHGSMVLVLQEIAPSEYLTWSAEEGFYRLAENTPAGRYHFHMKAPDGSVVDETITVTSRRIALQLPTRVEKQDPNAKMGDITYGELPVVSGSWAPCDADSEGAVTGTLAAASVEPMYTNTAGTAYHKDDSLETCGYYVIGAKDTLSNYDVTFRAGSLSVIGGNQPITFGVRPFEGKDVGTLYMVSPDYAYTRESMGMTLQEAVGSKIVFNAVPDEGYQVYDWYVDGKAQGTTATSFACSMLNQNTTVEVQFVFKPDTLVFGIAGATEGGTLVCSDSQLNSGSIVIPNSYLTFTAQAKEGYHFKEWRYTELGNGTAYYDEDDGKMSSTFTLLMPKSSCSLYAIFERDGYTLSYTDQHGIDGLTAWYWGSLTGDTTAELEKITVESGDTVPGDTEIVVQAREGYELDPEYNFVATGSQGVADYEKGTYTLVLTEDTTVSGYAIQNHFDVTLAFNIAKTYAFCEGAQVILTVDGTEYVYDCPKDDTTYSVSGISGGSKVSVSVNHPDYYIFEGWDINGTVMNAKTYTVSELGKNTVFTLNLTEKPVHRVTLANIAGRGSYTVTLPAGAGQEGNVVTCHANDPLTIQVTPETGYTVTYWNVTAADGQGWESKSSSLKYQFPLLTADYTFTPVFAETTYHIVSWPTMTYYGVTLTPAEGYLTTVTSGKNFEFTLSGGEDEYSLVLVNGLPFYPVESSSDSYPYRYEVKDGKTVYTIYNITEDQEVSVSEDIPNFYMLVNPVEIDVPVGKTTKLTATPYNIKIGTYIWSVNGEVVQESADNTFEYQAPFTPDITDSITVQGRTTSNGDRYVSVTATAKIQVTDAVKSIDITADTLTASEDGSFLIYPITPTGEIGSYDFNALITMYSGKTASDVTWSLWGAQMRGTSVDENGVLTVSNKEYGTNSQLKLIATHTYTNGDTDRQEVIINLCPDAYVATEVVNNIHGSVSQIGYVADGTTVTVTATPDENHNVAGWSINGVAVADNTTNTLTLTAEEMHHYQVNVEFTHYYPEAKHDQTNHWYECSCGDRSEVEEHYDFDKNHHCDKCDYRMSECVDEDKDHFCDWCSQQMTECADEDKDHLCDWCSQMLTVCTDEDIDHVCDWCGETISECEDANSNHFCDYCKKTLTECKDDSLDHNCDICGRKLTDCADENSDHNCDICSKELSKCSDEDSDHLCDTCGKPNSECTDENKDHTCDICGKENLTDCTDTSPADHKCDICGKELSQCADDNKDHNCDVCGQSISECKDDNSDHICDICGTSLGSCVDEDNNHLCDVCNISLSSCADDNQDHLCDKCGKSVSECADETKDHNCDICGKRLTPCQDEDSDNVCDICGKPMNVHTCQDEDSDHLCDTCGKSISECADENKDHSCDICGESVSQCKDENKDHNCDTCGKELSKCADDNKDHNCDVCGTELSKCKDETMDHRCDVCDAELSKCEDQNKDHSCDVCGTVLSMCVDEDSNHICDICDVTMTTCLDYITDHICDICGTELNVHTDDNSDHLCDLAECGKTLSECADRDKDHRCDVCGTELSKCEDEDSDHICDICGKTVSECTDEVDAATGFADHKCDICEKVLTQCSDTAEPIDGICDVCGEDMHECVDKQTVDEAGHTDHLCDVCGYQLSECVDELEDEEGNTDHSCDICGKKNSVCVDDDSDHNCDVCGEKLTDCADTNDHNCDVCGKPISSCYDKNHDDACDLCGAKTYVHADQNSDHRCDVCALPLSECDDGNKDHLCDVCAAVWTVCADQDKNHVCDICGGSVGAHTPAEGSHICEYCGKAMSQCKDDDKDHICDVCGEELSKCADDSRDHLCDICGKVLSECADEDYDHLCDICGKVLSECVDEDKDEHCDICDEIMTYAIRITAPAGGTVTADKEAAAKDETVTVTAEPALGYLLDSIIATAADGSAVHLTEAADGTYTFIQPSFDVTIEAVFSEKPFSISFASMTMANSLDMNFAFKRAYREDWSGYYAKIEKEYEGKESAVQYIFYEDWKTTTINGEEYYYVTFTGIAAKEMTDKLFVTIYAENGTAVSTVWEDSVQAQAMRNLAKANVTKEAQTMVVDMLNYGAAAQQRFEYNLANLANSQLSEEQKAFATASVAYVDTSIHGNNYRANVYLVSNIQFMMAFTGIDQSMNAVVSFKDHYGVAHEITIPGSEFTQNGSYYVLTIEETVMADAYQNINCKIYAANGALVTQATDSVACYAARAKQNTGNDLYEMIMRFASSAYAYLHNK